MTIKKLIFTEDVKAITNEQMEEIFKNTELKFDDLQYMITNEGSRVNSKKNSNVQEIKINAEKVKEIAEQINKEMDIQNKSE